MRASRETLKDQGTTDPLDGATAFEGELAATSDPVGHTTSSSYDAPGRFEEQPDIADRNAHLALPHWVDD